MSCGLSFLFNISESNKGTVVDTLQKRWKSTYDIVVRPPESLHVSDANNGLLEPNFLSNIQGGISFDQYDEIKRMNGIDVAAPIAMIGYTGLGIQINKKIENVVQEPGVYKETNIMSQDNSYQTTTYFTVGDDYFINPRLASNPLENGLYSHSTQLLVGIDPVQEAKLVGLDDTLAKFGQNRYFNLDADEAFGSNGKVTIPVLINPNPIGKMMFQNKVDKIDVSQSQIIKLQSQNQDDITAYLDQKKSEKNVYSFTASGKQLQDTIFNETENTNPFTGEKQLQTIGTFQPSSVMFYKTNPISYKEIESPFKERWKYAFQVNEQKLDDKDATRFPSNTFRMLNAIPVKERPTVRYDVLGFFDPSHLKISKDPLSELPMETYRAPSAKLVLNGKDEPVNPPVTITSSGTPVGLLTEQPTLITTLGAAKLLGGEKPISAIRIRVAGVKKISDENQKKVEDVARQIEKRTGLIADVTIGSSPQPVLIHIQKIDHDGGWIEQPWIHLGASYTIFKETSMGFSGVIATVIAVAIIYVLATNYVSLLSRKKDFAVLLSLGWKTKDLFRLVMIECGLLSAVSLFLVWGISFIWAGQGHAISILKLLIASLFVILIYYSGSLISGSLIRKITPYETIQTGEVSTMGKRFISTNGIVKMVLNQVLGKFQRNMLSILAIAFPTALVSFFLFITFRLKGVMYSTWMGEFLVMKIGTNHYIAMGIACFIAIVTTAEITWQNVVERKREFSMLMAVGWTQTSLKTLIYLEGIIIGLIGGGLGVAISILMIIFLYGNITFIDFLYVLPTIVIPLLIGFIASIIPSRILSKISPFIGLKG
ncbi:FtsX-like permease family protein [Falsibacillus albus]|nr:ABC transporter permease [Falsibacillus albus]